MKKFRFRFLAWTLGALLLLLLCAVSALCCGETVLPFWRWFSLEAGSTEQTILLSLRLPRVLTAVATGGMLALSGCVLQGVFRNPLVEPYTLGLSGGASLGVAAAFVCGGSVSAFLPVSAFALIGALTVSVLLLVYYHFKPRIGSLLLAGIMLGILCSSCTSLLMSLSSPEDLTRILYWTMGSLENGQSSQAFLLCGFSLAGLLLCVLLSQRINLLAAGLEDARHLGVNTKVLIPVLMVLASCMTALSVAAAGIIGFVGLVIPHILRNISGNDYRILVPTSFFFGAAFLILCDLIARTIIRPSQLPLGVVTGIIGGGVFVYLLLKSKNQVHV